MYINGTFIQEYTYIIFYLSIKIELVFETF